MIDPSILRAMLAAGATAEMIVVAVEAAIESDRAKWRERKMSQRQVRVSQRKEIPPTPPKEKLPPVLPTEELSPNDFDEFWAVYPKRAGKRAALKAHRNALKRAEASEILAGAKRYAASRPDPKFTKHPATWLNADCWLDEPDKKHDAVVRGPWKSFEPEPLKAPLSPEQKAEALAKLDEAKRKLAGRHP